MEVFPSTTAPKNRRGIWPHPLRRASQLGGAGHAKEGADLLGLFVFGAIRPLSFVQHFWVQGLRWFEGLASSLQRDVIGAGFVSRRKVWGCEMQALCTYLCRAA